MSKSFVLYDYSIIVAENVGVYISANVLSNYYSKEHSIQYIKPELKFLRKQISYLKQKLINIRKKGTFKWINEQFVSDSVEGDGDDNSLDNGDDHNETCVISDDDNTKTCDGSDTSSSDGDTNNDTNYDTNDDTNDDTAEYYQDQRKSSWFSGFHRYKERKEIDERLENGKALCGFLFQNEPGIVGIAFGRGQSKVEFVKLKISPAGHEELCGLHYFRFDLSTGGDLTKEYIRKNAYGFCILLPYIEKGCRTNQKYSLVTDDWKTLDEHGDIHLPSLSNILFNMFN